MNLLAGQAEDLAAASPEAAAIAAYPQCLGGPLRVATVAALARLKWEPYTLRMSLISCGEGHAAATR